MKVDDLDLLDKCQIYKVEGLSQYLENRSDSQDFGMIIDSFRKKIIQDGTLTDQYDSILRGLHLRYQGRLLINNPISILNSLENNDSYVIKDFCDKLAAIECKDSYDKVIELYESYKQCQNIYINFELFDQLYRLKAFDEAFDIVQRLCDVLFEYSSDIWNCKEAVYGASMVLNRISSIIKVENLENSSKVHVVQSIIKLTYLLLTRVICWPESATYAKRTIYELPISYEHRICALLKRINLLEKYSGFFEDRIPGLSTVDTLMVSDYYSAHEFSFALSTLGRISEFKRDARNKYKSITLKGIRPYSTCIADGKKDSLELAYRFFLEYKNNAFALKDESRIFLRNDLQNILSTVSNREVYKKDKDQILEFLHSNNIEYFYHFTEKANLINIRKSKGLFSLRECLCNSIIPKTSGEMRHLRTKDAEFYLEDYVRLSFCKRHPLIQGRIGSLVLLKFKIDVAILESTLFSDRDAALDNHEHGNRYEDLKKVHIDAVKRTFLDSDDPEFPFCQAEIMVKSFIPLKYIVNLDNPELL